jgi:hypothetical protein
MPYWRHHMNATSILLAASLSLVPALSAELTNAEIESSEASGSLSQRIDHEAGKTEGPVWIAYEVPMIDAGYEICCGSRRRAASCELDERDRGIHMQHRPGFGDQELLVLLHLREGSIQRIRIFSASCPVNADGRRVLWMQGIEADDSVATLRDMSFANTRVSDEALSALALHDSSHADRVLEEIATSGPSSDLREEAVFWLGDTRGEAGLRALERLLETHPDSELRGEIAFALSESPVPEALDSLIELAQSDPSSEVRGEAIFWLAQRGGIRAEEVILQAVASDPHSGVRDEAIFALSELPDGAGVDRLIQVIRSRDMPRSARQEAVFWLGQTEDPRAMEFFEKALQD